MKDQHGNYVSVDVLLNSIASLKDRINRLEIIMLGKHGEATQLIHSCDLLDKLRQEHK